MDLKNAAGIVIMGRALHFTCAAACPRMDMCSMHNNGLPSSVDDVSFTVDSCR
jgi:hypothetical protein